MIDIVGYMETGIVKACYKCGEVSKHHTACLTCLNKMKAEHEEFEDIWGIEPNKIKETMERQAKIAKLYTAGYNIKEIAEWLGISSQLAHTTMLTLVNKGVVTAQEHRENRKLRSKTCKTSMRTTS